MENAIQKTVVFLNDKHTTCSIILIYCFCGFCLMVSNHKMPQWYLVILLFFVGKMITGYDKCTLSYIECKFIRNVPKKDGLLNALVNGLVNNTNNNVIILLLIIYSCIASYYFFVIKKNRIRF